VLYAATNAPSGSASFLHKINGADLSLISTVMLDPRDGSITTLQLDRKRGYLYAGTDSSPARIVRLKLSRFERVNFIEFPTGWNRIGSPSLGDGELAIFTINEPWPRLVTIGLDGFKWQETLELPKNTAPFSSAANDPVTAYSVWYTDSVPSTVFRVRLCNFTVVDTTVLRPSDGVPRAAVYGAGKITAGTSCSLTSLDNLCASTFKSTFLQLKNGRPAQCDFSSEAMEPTSTTVDSIVSLRFNFKGMIPPVQYCTKNSTSSST